MTATNTQIIDNRVDVEGILRNAVYPKVEGEVINIDNNNEIWDEIPHPTCLMDGTAESNQPRPWLAVCGDA